MTTTLTRKGDVGQPTTNTGHFATAPERAEAADGMLVPPAFDARKATIADIDRIMVFDTETTGVDVDGDRIVSAYCGIMDRDGNITSSRTWLIDPGVNIPEAASKVHGISNEVARADGRNAKDAVAEIARVLDWCAANGVPVTAYNASFDISIIDAEARRHYGSGFPGAAGGPVVLDPHIIDKHISRRSGSRRLTDTAAHYGVELENAHEAQSDAVAAGLIAWKVMATLPQDTTLHQLMLDQQQWAQGQADSFQDWLRRTKDPKAVVDGRWPLRPGFAAEPAAA